MEVLKHEKNYEVELAKKLGAKEEQVRILGEIEKLDLPLGIWPLLKPIFNEVSFTNLDKCAILET